MKILFTGASSFTGYWFVNELVQAGHEVVAIYQEELGHYTDGKAKRIQGLCGVCEPVEKVVFGDSAFLDLISSSNWDLFCHHAADVRDYKSPDFDATRALASNTNNLRPVLEALVKKGCQKVLLTGSVFEQNEGIGPNLHQAFSPYGLSKGLTAEVVRHYTESLGMTLGKFVIPNPFGPFEEFRFTSFLVKSWFEKKVPSVSQPNYVRDNIHVSLLAKCYAHFATNLTTDALFHKINPSQYAAPQGVFVQIFADNLRKRLGLSCEYTLGNQTDFPEPKIRINSDPIKPADYSWVEEEAWDQLANFYIETFSKKEKVTVP